MPSRETWQYAKVFNMKIRVFYPSGNVIDLDGELMPANKSHVKAGVAIFTKGANGQKEAALVDARCVLVNFDTKEVIYHPREFFSSMNPDNKKWLKANPQWPPSFFPHTGFPKGGVYMVKAGPYYKIGKAEDFDKRLKQIQALHPEPVEVVHKIYTYEATKTEKEWHSRFANQRRNNEWFDLADSDVAEFKQQS